MIDAEMKSSSSSEEQEALKSGSSGRSAILSKDETLDGKERYCLPINVHVSNRLSW